ncbi:MAB_1171c family putative transporter [Streptomyces sp. NPDC005865]|uniref:MAB_1171c family putative transporter n=1 Tax=Streptomyces sp. NPDC005865 TaxID=3155453 RepID=UPI0033CEE351
MSVVPSASDAPSSGRLPTQPRRARVSARTCWAAAGFGVTRTPVVGAIPLFAVGLSYSGIATRLATWRIWRRHRRAYRQLRPLWSMPHAAFPESTLYAGTPAAPWREALHVRRMHRRHYRRVIECRDGLVRLSPHLTAVGLREGAPPETVATLLPRALAAQAAGEPATSRAVGIILPAKDTLNADAQQLTTVSRSLSAPPPVRAP